MLYDQGHVLPFLLRQVLIKLVDQQRDTCAFSLPEEADGEIKTDSVKLVRVQPV
jgi:hypothetical protein